jgi:hypothetical protein
VVRKVEASRPHMPFSLLAVRKVEASRPHMPFSLLQESSNRACPTSPKSKPCFFPNSIYTEDLPLFVETSTLAARRCRLKPRENSWHDAALC